MIVCTHDIGLVPFIQYKTSKPIVVMNLSAGYSNIPQATELIAHMRELNTNGMPLNEFVNTVAFDMEYAELIINNPLTFHTLLRIIAGDYCGYTVVLMIMHDPYRDCILESLIKLIQVRYGIRVWIVNELDDVESLQDASYYAMNMQQIDEDLSVHDAMFIKGMVPDRLFTNQSMEDFNAPVE